jgi:hypothetical protein
MKRRAIDVRSATLLEVAYARTGSMRRAARVAAFVAAWGIVRRDLGRTPTVDEYADYWREARATAFRDQALFREVFADGVTPDDVLDAIEAARAREGDPLDLSPLVAA